MGLGLEWVQLLAEQFWAQEERKAEQLFAHNVFLFAPLCTLKLTHLQENLSAINHFIDLWSTGYTLRLTIIPLLGLVFRLLKKLYTLRLLGTKLDARLKQTLAWFANYYPSMITLLLFLQK